MLGYVTGVYHVIGTKSKTFGDLMDFKLPNIKMTEIKRPKTKAIIRVDNVEAEINWQLAFFYYIQNTPPGISNEYLLPNIWQIIESFFWWHDQSSITLSVPITEIIRQDEDTVGHKPLKTVPSANWSVLRFADRFCGYEDGSPMELCLNSMPCTVSGYYPLRFVDIPFTLFAIRHPDMTKRALIQCGIEQYVHNENPYYVIWDVAGSYEFSTFGQVELFFSSHPNYHRQVLIVNNGMLGVVNM